MILLIKSGIECIQNDIQYLDTYFCDSMEVGVQVS